MTAMKTLIATLALGFAAFAQAVPQVKVVGEGRPVLMIPGLASGAEVWTEACAALQPGVQCHLVQLPGFAGSAPVPNEPYLEAQRDALRAYLKDKGLSGVDIVGHSLGGNLALMLAAAEPQQVRRLVIVDSLPFLAALRNPAATPEQAKQMGAGMRAQMKSQGDKPMPEAQHKAMAQGMTRSAEGQQTLVRWGLASDPATVAQAMSEIWGGDFRPLLPKVEQPTLLLGSWAAYQPMGATLESTRALFERQYQGLKHLRIAMSEKGFHFLMWDDRDWLAGQLREFLR